MKKVITYGTFDLLHEGHINLLRRARALGDHLTVGVTSDAYDRYRGKLNVRQSVTERIASVRDTGFADEIIIEEYEGQKIEDIRKRNIDIITLGSDWTGKIDYLKKYCEVVYLPRTPNISSTLLRTGGKIWRIGILCDYPYPEESLEEIKLVAGTDVNAVSSRDHLVSDLCKRRDIHDFSDSLEDFAGHCDMALVDSCVPGTAEKIKALLDRGRHVLAPHGCGLSAQQWEVLRRVAEEKKVCLLAAPGLVNLTAYAKLVNIGLSGSIGTLHGLTLSVSDTHAPSDPDGLLRTLGPACLLPVTQLLGWGLEDCLLETKGQNSGCLISCALRLTSGFAHISLAKNVPTENRCVIQGDSGYINVPAPWWETDYFELVSVHGKKKKFSWPMNGSALRYQIADFVKTISEGRNTAAQTGLFVRLVQLAENLFGY